MSNDEEREKEWCKQTRKTFSGQSGSVNINIYDQIYETYGNFSNNKIKFD